MNPATLIEVNLRITLLSAMLQEQGAKKTANQNTNTCLATIQKILLLAVNLKTKLKNQHFKQQLLHPSASTPQSPLRYEGRQSTIHSQ